MKRNIIILSFALAMTALGCKDIAPEDISTGQGYFRFSASAPLTRTSIEESDDAIVISWTEDDEIGIFGYSGGASTGSNYPYLAIPDSEDAARCVFRFRDYGSIYQNVAPGTIFYAYCPFEEEWTDKDPSALPLAMDSVLVQSVSEPLGHLERQNLMTAMPVTVNDNADGADFKFQTVFPVAEFRIVLSEDSAIDEVAVESAELISSSQNLIITDGSADITQGTAKLTETAGRGRIRLTFDGEAILSKNDALRVYFILAPGTHPDGTLTLKLTASDNSVARIPLQGSVEFRQNGFHVKDLNVNVTDFEATGMFDVDVQNTTVKAGEPVTFDFSGNAEKVLYWSGEDGHEYSEEGNELEPSVFIEFSSLYVNGMQRNCGSVKYSVDFSGTYSEEDILSATWHDVSSQFQLPPYITASSSSSPADPEANPLTEPYLSGKVDATSWFKDNGTPVYFAFFYHVDVYDADYVDEKTGIQGNGRTWWQIYTVNASAEYENGTQVPLIEIEGEEQSQIEIVNSSAYSAANDNSTSRKGVTSGGTTVIRMQSTFRPTTERDAWAIVHPIYMPESIIVPVDEGVEVAKDDNGAYPDSMTYIYSEPGEYRMVFIITVNTLYGTHEMVEEFIINVEE